MLFNEFHSLAIIAPTLQGARLFQPYCATLAATLWVPESVASALNWADADAANLVIYSDSLKATVTQQWQNQKSFIFCLATGAVVRLIAPLLQQKQTDPAVVVVDESGRFVISLSGGHQGGADRLTRSLASLLGATPVLTGVSNQLGLPGIDILGQPFGWQRGEGDWTAVSAAIARQAPVQVQQTAGSSLWQSHLPKKHSFQFLSPEPDASSGQTAPTEPHLNQARVWIGPELPPASPEQPQVSWHPRVLWVGIGCERGTSRPVIETAIQQACQSYHLAEAAIAGIATLDLKADEVALLEVCQERGWPLRVFSGDRLRQVPVPNPSEVVAAEVGTPSVAEAAALVAAQTQELRVTKQIVRLEGQPGAVTLAIAQAEQEYTGREGQLWLVGTGPGQLNQITPAAQTAITQADVVVGYSLYVELVQSLLRPGQIVERLPITQERERAQRAIELATWGLSVAVISSGDCGIYGMAGLVMEELRRQGWNGKTPAVQVFPGISALQSAASRVGAPLMHDFCAISLSDLLTPWEMIEKRLTAAAQADFVTALYNPRSQKRVEQIEIAQQIFLRYRHPQTPVAIVRSAYRPDEQITLTTLEQMLEKPIDMMTTVLIGNQSTFTLEQWMITPRGYLGNL